MLQDLSLQFCSFRELSDFKPGRGQQDQELPAGNVSSIASAMIGVFFTCFMTPDPWSASFPEWLGDSQVKDVFLEALANPKRYLCSRMHVHN